MIRCGNSIHFLPFGNLPCAVHQYLADFAHATVSLAILHEVGVLGKLGAPRDDRSQQSAGERDEVGWRVRLEPAALWEKGLQAETEVFCVQERQAWVTLMFA
jgi:hypothetical protein